MVLMLPDGHRGQTTVIYVPQLCMTQINPHSSAFMNSFTPELPKHCLHPWSLCCTSHLTQAPTRQDSVPLRKSGTFRMQLKGLSERVSASAWLRWSYPLPTLTLWSPPLLEGKLDPWTLCAAAPRWGAKHIFVPGVRGKALLCTTTHARKI